MTLCGTSTNYIKFKAWGRRDGSALKSTCSRRGPGLTPGTHMVAHIRGICPLLPSVGTRHTQDAHIDGYTGKTYTHIKEK